MGYEPLAFMRSWAVAAVDPGGQLLMGPALAMPKALERAGLELATWTSSRCTRRSRRRSRRTSRRWSPRPGRARSSGARGPVGKVDRSRLNVCGGSIALGHPFGATGRAAHHDPRERDEPAGRPVRPGLGVRPGWHGLRDGARSDERCVSTGELGRRRRAGAHARRARREGQHAGPRAHLPSSTRLLGEIEGDVAVTAVVLRSGKPDNFIAGADIKDFARSAAAKEGEALSRAGQAILDRLEALPRAGGGGHPRRCLGGGLEMALACRYRVASDDPKTRARPARGEARAHPGRGRHAAAAAARRPARRRST